RKVSLKLISDYSSPLLPFKFPYYLSLYKLTVSDCRGNPFCEERSKRLERKARPSSG
ncbi:hypothetical protein ACVWYG_002889, partial [Pedobacter sp. UYEF25]